MTWKYTEESLTEQTAIDNDLMNNFLKQSTKLREARDILLTRLMSGEMGV